jgi:hypothetical protein
MAARDHHTALKSELVTKTNAGSFEIVLAKLQWSKDRRGAHQETSSLGARA